MTGEREKRRELKLSSLEKRIKGSESKKKSHLKPLKPAPSAHSNEPNRIVKLSTGGGNGVCEYILIINEA